MDAKPLLQSLRLRNILSFGDAGERIDFGPLNVLVGANGSGKSNVLEILALLRSLPKDMSQAIRAGGGIEEWIWKGGSSDVARIDSFWNESEGKPPLHHRIGITPDAYRARVTEESVDRIGPEGLGDLTAVADSVHKLFYEFPESGALTHPNGLRPGFEFLSALTLKWVPANLPELNFLADHLGEIRLYRGWSFGPGAAVRKPQAADLPGDFLLEDYSNLGLILNGLTAKRHLREKVLGHLKQLYEGVADLRTTIVSGHVQVHIEEEDGRSIPMTRLSDGTIRYLCLLALLCHPNPPPLIGIEEPELGLHPDIIPEIARLLVDASERTQLVVTTHSPAFLSALGDRPEAILTCERDADGTRLKRLDRDCLRKWLDEYTLGDLWLSGEIGATRW